VPHDEFILPDTHAAHLRRVTDLLKSVAFHYSDESGLQAGIAELLDGEFIPYEREARLSSRDRIDFILSTAPIGIECKTQGSPSETTRQLLRYAESPKISALILVTGRLRLARLPGMMLGKPMVTIPLWNRGF
jgi:hypothetical protein